MTDLTLFFEYLAVMAGVTYLVRMLPLVLCKKKIENRFIQSFLYYIPYAVLGAMTFPAIFSSTGNVLTATAGCITALVLAWFEKSLLTVAACASAAVLIFELIL
ncbi:MAG: AzlD domain-containing protein [Treponemataceae bacterium]|nr:AzlD domain-containing protein [Treponemataceae bacterium]